MRPATVGIDGREFARGKFTGIGKYLYNLLSNAVIEGSNSRFILYLNQFSEMPMTLDNLEVRVIPEGNTLWWDQIVLAREIKRERVELFFSPLDKIPVLANCPAIVTIHDLLFFYIPAYKGLKRRLYEYLYLLSRFVMVRKAACVLTVSEYSKADIMKILKVPEKKIKVVPSGIFSHYYQVCDRKDINMTRERYGISKPYILYVGNFRSHKNVLGLVKAYEKLTEKMRGDFQLVLAGNRDAESVLIERYALMNGLKDNIVFTGFVREEDMPFLYSGADLFVFPSLYEGFGLPPLEAMACGVPVIASHRTSLPEVVGDAGILTDVSSPEKLSQAIAGLLSDRKLIEELKKKGLARSREFMSAKTAERIIKVMEEVLEEKR